MKPEEKSFTTADDREYTFLFDIEGLIAVEDCANGPDGNANLQQIVTGALNKRLGYLRALVYGGLREHHPTISRAEAAALIETDGKALGAAMWPAFFSAMPENKGNPRKAATGAGTGSRSSPPGAKRASPKNGSGSRRRAATPSS